MRPLAAWKALSAYVAGTRERQEKRGRGRGKVHVPFLEKSHFNARCDEEEWGELPGTSSQYGTYARLRWFYCLREAQEGLRAQVGLRPAQERQDGAKDMCQDRWNRGRAEEDTDGDA